MCVYVCKKVVQPRGGNGINRIIRQIGATMVHSVRLVERKREREDTQAGGA